MISDLYIVVEFDMEEADADQSIRRIYGPFPTEEAAEAWAEKKWDTFDSEYQEFTGLSVELVSSPELDEELE